MLGLILCEPLSTYLSADREPSMIQMVSLSASMLMILYSQSKAWYAAKPEEKFVQDVARKMALSLVLLMPNTAVLGVGVIIVVMGSWHTFTMVGYCFAGVCPILLIVCCCACVSAAYSWMLLV